MSAAKANAKLSRLAAPEAAVRRHGDDFGVFRSGDRRRRPALRVTRAELRAWLGEGLIARLDEAEEAYGLTPAGLAAARRENAEEAPFLAQHRAIQARAVADEDGEIRWARGFDPHVALKRLAALRDADGRAFLSEAELRAANKLKQDWEASQAGLARGSDWSAPPRGGSSRGPSSAAQIAMDAACDARRRVMGALERLAPPLRRVVERVCLHEDGVEALERKEGWPSRSGKIALKLGLAQLALGLQ